MADYPIEDFTVGVEEEYQLIDASTGELRSRARAVLESDWTGDIKPEMQQNTVEVGTRVCRTPAELRAELERLRLAAAVAAESGGLRVVAAGTHPFTHYLGQEFTPEPTYQRIRAEYRQLADSQNIFGMHVHVAVPEAVDRTRVMNVVRHYAAHLLALSASSPYFLGEDTGYASYRSILWRRWPRSGVPPRFADHAEFLRLVQGLVDSGRMDAPGRLYWEMRPHHAYPTLEFRVADVTPRLDDAIAIAGLARALVIGAAEGILAEPALPEGLTHPFLVENGWRASRDGIHAELVDLSRGEPRTLRASDAVGELCDRLMPLLAQLDGGEVVKRLEALLRRGHAAERICREATDLGGDLRQLALWMADETVLGLGMDRRQEQRDEA